jgi:hypothetical protein
MDIDKLDKLVQLQKVRIRAHEKKLALEKKAYLEASQKLEQRKKEINAINGEHKNLNRYIRNQIVAESPTKRERVYKRRFWLNYDLEMHEYYHEQEIISKEEAYEQYTACKNNWMREKQKSQQLRSTLKNENQKQCALIEYRDDELSQEDQSKIWGRK